MYCVSFMTFTNSYFKLKHGLLLKSSFQVTKLNTDILSACCSETGNQETEVWIGIDTCI